MKLGFEKVPDVVPENGIVLAVAMLIGVISVSKVISNRCRLGKHPCSSGKRVVIAFSFKLNPTDYSRFYLNQSYDVSKIRPSGDRKMHLVTVKTVTSS